jgi:hypothetical protein
MVLAHIQNTAITRSDGKLVVEYPKPEDARPAPAKAPTEATAENATESAPQAELLPEPVQPTPEQQPASPEEPATAVSVETPADE